MFRRMLPVAVIAAMGLCGFAAADDGKKPGKKGDKKPDPVAMFKKLDENSDGKLSREEFAKIGEMRKKDGNGGKGGQVLDKVFDRLDEDKSGSLSPDELKKMGEQIRKKKDK